MSTIKEIVKEDYKDAKQDDYTGYLEDLASHGCQSGMVGHLIYYTDTCAFYKAHKEEIKELLSEMCDSTGLSIQELFGDKWDSEDPFADDDLNQNLLAWFGYEETARNYASEIGIEV